MPDLQRLRKLYVDLLVESGLVVKPQNRKILQFIAQSEEGVKLAEVLRNWPISSVRPAVTSIGDALKIFHEGDDKFKVPPIVKYGGFRLELQKPVDPNSNSRAPIGYKLALLAKATNLTVHNELWVEYFTHDHPPLVISTEPVVFVDRIRRISIRVLDINCNPALRHKKDMSDAINAFLEKLPSDERAYLSKIVRPENAMYHYQPSGEVLAALEFEKFFDQEHLMMNLYRDKKLLRPCTRLLVDQVKDDGFSKAPAILLGNIRTNPLLKECQETIEAMYSRDAKKQGRMEADHFLLGGHRFEDRDKKFYCMLSRFRDPESRQSRTLIAAHNGRGIQAVVEGLLPKNAHSEKNLVPTMWAMLGTDNLRSVDSFQAFFEVTVREGNLGAANCELKNVIKLS